MSLRRHLAAGFRVLFRKNRVEADLDDELRSYLEASVEEKVEAGLSRQEALRAARLEMGSVESVKDEVRDAGWEHHLETLWQDARYGLRTLARSPGFATVAVLTLALGIGANTTIFTVVDSTLLKKLPFPDPDRLVLVWKTHAEQPDDVSIISAPDFWDWERQNHVFERMAIFDSAGKVYNLGAEGGAREAEGVSGLRVTAGFFQVLGVEPFLGRGFLPEEETLGKDHEVVLSHGLWSLRYGSDPALVGNTIRIDGRPYTVVGVMPPDFQFQFWSGPRQLFVPAGFTAGDRLRDSNSFIAVARLRPGMSIEQAQAEMATIQTALSRQYPKESPNSSAAVVEMGAFGLTNLRQVMVALLAAVGFVLLVACVNVANLLLARGARRARELAIRRAIGASAGRIARLLLVESLLLSVLGGAAGLLVAVWGSLLLVRILPRAFSMLPFRPLDGVHLDGSVLAFTLIVSGVTGILFGLVPVSSALRKEVSDPLKEHGHDPEGRGRDWTRYVLVASETGLTLVVLCGAALMIESMARVLRVDPGFDPSNVLTMRTSVPQINTYYGPPVKARFCQDLTEQLGSVSGVVSVGAVAHLPLQGTAGRGFFIEGRPVPAPGEVPGASYSVACPGYFRTLGVPILSGREFDHQDTLGSSPVIVVNQAMAERFWPNEDALGKRIRLGITGTSEPWLTIIGVVGNTRHWGLDRDVRPQFFRPYTQAAWPWMTAVVRTAATPMSFFAPIARALARAEPDQPVSNVKTMEDIVAASVGSRRFPMLLLSAFALLALTLAAVGIVGVVSYSVEQRHHEIGVRLALGATRRDIVTLFVGRIMVWVLAGIAAGLVGSLGLARLVQTLLFDIRPADLAVLAAVSALLALVALAASYVPARRGAKLDPVIALRAE